MIKEQKVFTYECSGKNSEVNYHSVMVEQKKNFKISKIYISSWYLW